MSLYVIPTHIHFFPLEYVYVIILPPLVFVILSFDIIDFSIAHLTVITEALQIFLVKIEVDLYLKNVIIPLILQGRDSITAKNYTVHIS